MAACVAKMGDEECRDRYFQRVIVVDDKNTALFLPALHRECIIIAAEGDALPTIYRVAERSGCRVIVCCAGSAGGISSVGLGFDELELGHPDENEVIKLVAGHGNMLPDAASKCAGCGFDYVKMQKEIFRC